MTNSEGAARLESALRALLARLDSRNPSAEALEQSAGRCQSAFELLQTAGATPAPDLERSRQLAALLNAVTARELDRTARRLRLARAARRALSAQAESLRSTGSCNCAG